MRYPAWIRSLGSVSAAIAVLAGCAGPAVDDVPRARDDGVLIRPGRPGFVVGTHGGHDTIPVVTDVARQTGYGLVVAPAAAFDPASPAAQAYEREMNGTGRILVRYSGTESLARVMIEGADDQRIRVMADDLAAAIRSEIGV